MRGRGTSPRRSSRTATSLTSVHCSRFRPRYSGRTRGGSDQIQADLDDLDRLPRNRISILLSHTAVRERPLDEKALFLAYLDRYGRNSMPARITGVPLPVRAHEEARARMSEHGTLRAQGAERQSASSVLF